MKTDNLTKTAVTLKGNNSSGVFNRILISLIITLGLTAFAHAQAPSNNIWESYGILSLNNDSYVYYDMNASSPNPDFNGATLGYFWPENSIVVKGGQNKTNKCNGGDITNGTLYWRVWLTANGPVGEFNSIPMDFIMNTGGSCGGDQLWQGIGGTTNILNTLPQSGQYTLEIYSAADGVPGTVYSNNGGANYRATFLYCTRPSVTLNITACDKYTWTSGTGVTYTENGNYPHTVVTPLGCDSTTTLHLQINHSTKSSMTDEACDSYVWTGIHGDGNTYTASGTYYNLTSNDAGCPDTNVLILTIHSTSVKIINVDTCGSYTWASPEGNDVTYTSSGSYNHTTTNSFGCTYLATLNLTFRTVKPLTPGLVSGINMACPNESNTYTVAQDPNADLYTWVPPVGATVSSGQGTNSVVISFGAGFVAAGTLTVKAGNCIGTSAARSFNIKFGVKPPSPIGILGPVDVCPFVFDGTEAIYRINKVARATGYNWSVSDLVNSHIISHLGTGINDTAITVHFDNAFTTGTITIVSVGNCGNSAAKSLTVNKKVPATPTITGNTHPCPNSIEIYTSSDVSATGYVWSIGTNNVATIIGGQGTPVLRLQFKDVFVRATISIRTSSICGLSAPGKLVVDKTGFCRAARNMMTSADKPDGILDINIFPNPAQGNFTIAINGAGTKGTASIDITNAYGQIVFSRMVNNNNGLVSLNVDRNLTAGLYMVICTVNNQRVTKRLMINK